MHLAVGRAPRHSPDRQLLLLPALGHGRVLGRPFTSAEFGLRIGSKPLLGAGVLRIDVAKPLDDVAGENDDWKVSLSVGQVFTFGNASGALR